AYFFRFIRSGVAEISIRNASHEDAQYPSEYALQAFGIDPYTTEELQITFASALTAAAFSLSSTGKFDYAWQSFGDALESGRVFKARKKESHDQRRPPRPRKIQRAGPPVVGSQCGIQAAARDQPAASRSYRSARGSQRQASARCRLRGRHTCGSYGGPRRACHGHRPCG